MRQSRVSKRYAKALINLSVERESLEESYKDILTLEKTCLDSNEFSLLLKSPIVKTDQKLRVFSNIFKDKIGKLVFTFVNIIIKKKREDILEQIIKSYINLYKEEKNIATATVTTVSEISEGLRNKIVSYIKSLGHKKVELFEEINKDLIGGMVIRIGDKQLDASVSGELLELRQTFNKNLFTRDL